MPQGKRGSRRYKNGKACTRDAKSVEWQGYGETNFSGCGRMCDRIEIFGGSGGQKAAGGLRLVPGNQ